MRFCNLNMNIQIEPAYGYPSEVKALFTEYTDMLIANDPKFKKYLDLQNYDEELKHLENKYGMPQGRLYLLRCDGAVAGCIALRRADEHHGELKRLYIKPAYRGKGLGRFLAERIIADAKQIGYRHVILDTLPFLESAIGMYKKMGFYEVAPFNNSPMDHSIYMRLDL